MNLKLCEVELNQRRKQGEKLERENYMQREKSDENQCNTTNLPVKIKI